MQRFFILLVMLMLTPCAGAQQETEQSLTVVGKSSGSPQFGRQRNPPAPEELRIEREQAKRMNEERQRLLKEDTDKLLKLATELKEYVDKTNENILSLEVIKKSEQIEKLAKSVREKMKISYGLGDEPQRR